MPVALRRPGTDAATVVRDGRESIDWSAVVRSEGPGLLRYARRLTRDAAEAEDLVHETFERALRAEASGRGFRGESSMATWLHRIVHHVAVDRARARRETVMDVDDLEARWADDRYSVDPELLAERAELAEEVDDALVRLPYEHRAAVVLHDVEGWTVPQIAAAHDLDLEVAKQRVRRGRRMLVTALAEGQERRVALRDVPLRCADARRQVGEYLDGELGDDERAMIDAHLRTCPTCPPLAAALVGVREQLGRRRDTDAVLPPDLVARLLEREGEAQPRPGRAPTNP